MHDYKKTKKQLIAELQALRRRLAELEAAEAEYKQNEEILRENGELFRGIFERSTVGKALTAPNGKLLKVNQAFASLLGYTVAEMERLNFAQLTHPEDVAKSRECIRCLLANERKTYRMEKRYLHKNGQVIWTDVSTTLFRNETRTPRYFITSITDITAQKRTEKQLRQSRHELTQKNKELEQIIYITSHDLRSPLVNVQGFSKELDYALQEIRELIQAKQIPDDIRTQLMTILEENVAEAIHYILSSIAKMDTLLSGLLRLSRLGRAALSMEEIDMNRCLSNVVNTLEFQTKEAGVMIDIASLPPCHGDVVQINQVFSNLIGNALKFLDPARPGMLKIWGKIQENQSIYCIEDNGIGIASEHQEHIFEIFHRLNPTQNSGEGLGLTIVRRILERHNGSIRVESELGRGSKFYVTLPDSGGKDDDE